MSRKKIIVVAGPTASGKSAMAVELASKMHGVIVNADAMQVYRGLPILSAQPLAEELAAVPHELYAFLDPDQASSAGKWLAAAKTTVAKILESGKMPILVGGTGLYFRAFFGGLAEIPAIPTQVRQIVQELYDEIGEPAFRSKLAEMDPDSAAKLAKNDRQRLIRAYEVVLYTGKAITYWQNAESPEAGRRDYEPEIHLLLPPREELYAACDRRFSQMIARGAVEEVREFLKRDFDPELPAMKTIGVREIGEHLQGTCSLDVAVTKSQQMTRNYAKRQLTWFRNQKLA